MRRHRILISCCAIALAGVSWWGYANWRSQHDLSVAAGDGVEATSEPSVSSNNLIVGDQAQQNLKLTAKPLKTSTYWKSITLPGSVVDRPGVSDREVAAPAIGVISEIRRIPGESVEPGDVIFTLKLTSDSLHETQANLFKTSEEIKLAQAKFERIRDAGDAIARSRVIEIENEIKRLEVSAKADQEQLRNRGLSAEDVDRVASGKLVTEISVSAPAESRNARSEASTADGAIGNASLATYELQELKVEVGQQVQAGQALCTLSNHRLMAIEGRAFRDETPLLERSLQNGWPVGVDFQESETADWPPIAQSFVISRVTNVIDPATRTFAFMLPLENQSKSVHAQQSLWRFRPGQKVWLEVRVEQLENVFVLPKEAVVWEGPEAFVFTQNVNTFERKGVRVLHQDRDRVVLANDGTFPTYRKNDETFTIPAVVQTAAAQLNRMTKSGSGGIPNGYHIHADGSLHKNEDEGK
jgi:membrane fusion protein, heavy metal efflux system